MMTYFDLPVVAILLIAATMNALHPVHLRAFPLLVGAMLGNHLSLWRALHGFLVYVALLFVWWVALGVIATGLLTSPTYFGFVSNVIVAIIATIAGLLEIAAALWSELRIMRFSDSTTRLLAKMAHRIKRPNQVVRISFSLNLAHLGLTGILYLCTLAVLNAPFPQFAALNIAGYTLIYLFPLLLMLGLTVRHYKTSLLLKWIFGHARPIRLLTGLLLVVLSWILLLTKNMLINLG